MLSDVEDFDDNVDLAQERVPLHELLLLGESLGLAGPALGVSDHKDRIVNPRSRE